MESQKAWVILRSTLVLLIWCFVQRTRGNEWNGGNCPLFCSCKLHHEDGRILRAVDCSRRNYSIIPKGVPPETEVLWLLGNSIATLRDSPDGLHPFVAEGASVTEPTSRLTALSNLQVLHLEQNYLSSIDEIILGALPVLKSLILSNNHISSVGNLSALSQLQHLFLDHNRITQLSDSAFRDLLHLEDLSLTSNLISVLPSTAFASLSSLSKLNLSRNAISHLSPSLFKGLDSLEILDLSWNRLRQVPTISLQTLTLLQSLHLDGNSFQVLSPKDFSSMSVKDLSLCQMNHLLLVNSEAFYNLTKLMTLRMSHNSQLSYIDPRAFHLLPSLEMLQLQNNHLQSLPNTLPKSLPRLASLSFEDNPLMCDCNVWWIRDQMAFEDSDHFFTHSERLTCQQPPAHAGVSLAKIALSLLPERCGPKVVIFQGNDESLPDQVQYHCRAFGLPAPQIHWILPTGVRMNGTAQVRNVKVEASGTLTVDRPGASNSGRYTCVAHLPLTNQSDLAEVILKVKDDAVRIMDKSVASTYITVTWNGTGSSMKWTNYILMFKSLEEQGSYHTIDLRPYMRAYTITNLRPHTSYQFCIASKYERQYQMLSCVSIQTKPRLFGMAGLRSMGNLSILITLAICCAIIGFLCLSAFVIRRYRRQKLYKEPKGINVAHRLEEISEIPLEDLLHPPSTSLCSSRTSLISQKSFNV